MIKTFHDLWDAMGNLKNPLYPETKLRVYLNGRYVIDHIWEDPETGMILLWLDERGDEQ